MANEISAAKRERDFYMSRVDRAKAEDAKEQRRRVTSTFHLNTITISPMQNLSGRRVGLTLINRGGVNT